MSSAAKNMGMGNTMTLILSGEITRIGLNMYLSEMTGQFIQGRYTP
jgi:hypothetical protein